MRRKKSLPLLWISLALVVVFLAAALVGASVWMKRFLRSEDFRRLVEAKTGQAMRAETEYSPLRWQGSSVFADSLKVRGTPGSIVKTFDADQIRAEVNWREVWNGAWRVERIDVVSFTGTFRPGSPEAGAKPGTPAVSGLAGILPKRFELGDLRIARARLGFRGADGGETLTLQDSALQVRPDGVGWAIEGSGGSLTLPSLPVLDVTSFRSRIQGAVFFLTDAALRLGANGKIKAAGEFAADSRLRVEWTQVDVAHFLDDAWKTRLTGPFSGTTELQWPVAGLSAGTVTGTFLMADGLLQNLQVLDQIATFTGAPQFRRMPLQEVSGDYRWSRGALDIANLVLESKGLMRIEGACALSADGALDGNLRVGVTPQTLQWLPGSRERVFTRAEKGYLWTDVRVGGTLQNPREDLSPRLAAAMKDEVIQQGEKALDVLPGPARDGAREVLDILKPLLP